MLIDFFFDTESCGLYSPTILIQYHKSKIRPIKPITRDDVIIHNIWTQPISESLELIQEMCENNVIGFNLAHDWFHLSRTYNILMELYPKNKPPKILDYHDIEDECHDKYCLKPKGALDLMLYGRTHDFQATMNQKDIVIRRVPRVLAEVLVKELEERIKIPKLCFAKRDGKQHWKIKNLLLDTTKEITPEQYKKIKTGKSNIKIDPNFVNIRLSFYPSTGLKPIMKYLLDKDIDLIENMLPLKRPVEAEWFPSSGRWLDVLPDHIFAWSHDIRRINYAKDDVVYLPDLFIHFKSPYDSIGEYNSMLACMVGSMHWRGFAVDLEQIEKQIKINKEVADRCLKEVNFNSPPQVINYLKEIANPIENTLINDSSFDTLINLKENGSFELIQRAKTVLEGRNAAGKLNLLKKLNLAKRLYVTFKVTGTKSNRMSGGSMEDSSSIGVVSKKGGSINPQGIKKGSDIRNIFILAHSDMVLDGGDFDGYEVTIFEAVSKDENLRKDLLSGKKMHGLWGESIYNKPYDYIVSTDGIPENEPEGYYGRSKKSFFAKLYDAQITKLTKVLQLPEEQVYSGIKHFEERYPGVAKDREKIYKDFSALSQPNGIGTAVVWKEPKKYIESFLGFKRFFDLEFETVKTLFELAQNPTDGMKEIGKLIKVVRRDRTQSASGALQSAVYAAAFSIQSSVLRSAINHRIQSPGGEMNKILQSRIWTLQPCGINKWVVMSFNMHDEQECPVIPEKQKKLENVVNSFIEEYKEFVPLLKMKWKHNLKSWGDK